MLIHLNQGVRNQINPWSVDMQQFIYIVWGLSANYETRKLK
jgi:hypothetical protein